MNARLLTDADMAEMLQTTESKVYEWRRRYHWPHIKVGRQVRYTEANVERILAAHTVVAAKADDSGLSKRSAARFVS